MILLFQLNKEEPSVDILFDKQGLEALRNIINKHWRQPIKKSSGLFDLDREHLSSKEWGGDELTPEFTSTDFEKIQSVKIVYLGEEGEAIIS